MGMAVLFVLSHIQYIIAAVVAYFCGCINGAILTSKLFFRDDVRTHGSGNAGLTNFYRTYGARYALLVIACDMLKAAVAVGFAVWISRYYDPRIIPDAPLTAVQQAAIALRFKYWAGLFCIVGHMFPVTAGFKGGKGILCGGTLMLLLDWRVALVGWGVFAILWGTTRYVSLGSVCAAISFPISTYFVYHSIPETIIITVTAMLVIWAHRKNIVRLLNGTESKFRFHVDRPKTEGEK